MAIITHYTYTVVAHHDPFRTQTREVVIDGSRKTSWQYRTPSLAASKAEPADTITTVSNLKNQVALSDQGTDFFIVLSLAPGGIAIFEWI